MIIREKISCYFIEDIFILSKIVSYIYKSSQLKEGFDYPHYSEMYKMINEYVGDWVNIQHMATDNSEFNPPEEWFSDGG